MENNRFLLWLEKTYFRYFSASTIDSDEWGVRYIVYLIILIPLCIGIVLDLFDKDWRIPVFIFSGMLLMFGIFWIITWFFHNWKIKKQNK
jgi:hypothetical protein